LIEKLREGNSSNDNYFKFIVPHDSQIYVPLPTFEAIEAYSNCEHPNCIDWLLLRKEIENHVVINSIM